jgi:hypothetical protein
VLELHDEHGCHFHVITNQRFPIRKILAFSARYGFGRLHVQPVSDATSAVRYICKYLSKPRPGCLKRARLWSAFGSIERTRVKDVLSDTPLIRILRRVMGKQTVAAELSGIDSALVASVGFATERNFRRAIEKANAVYLFGFDPDYFERQERWARFAWRVSWICRTRGRPGIRWNGKDRLTMLSARHASSVHETIALLNCRRLPGRLNSTEAAVILGFKEHDIPTLVAAKLLSPLGRPASNAPKYFASIDIQARAEDRDWLSQATRCLARFWNEKNSKKKLTGRNNSPGT